METEGHFILRGINDSDLAYILAHKFTFFSYDKIKDEINIVCEKGGSDTYCGLLPFAEKLIDFHENVKKGRTRLSRRGDLFLSCSKQFNLYISGRLIGSFSDCIFPVVYNMLIIEIEVEEDAIIRKRTLKEEKEILIQPFNLGNGWLLKNGELCMEINKEE
jgi:hypothetical protein